jgi:hypothetical protein
MSINSPKVSFLVPVYNASEYGIGYLEQLCTSISAQTFSDFEVLFGDDGSCDNTREILQPFLRDPRFRLLSWKPNRGLHSNVFFLLSAARGEFWCPPGQDDILDSRFLEKRLPLLASHPEAALIHGGASWIDEKGDPYLSDTISRGLPELGRRLPRSLFGERMIRILLQHNIINWPSTLVRMDITRLVLPFFSPYYHYAMDWVLWILIAATGHDFLWDEEPLIQYRMHSQSISGSPKRKVLRQVERKLAPMNALRAASQFSPLAKAVWFQERTALYHWWLSTAVGLSLKGALRSQDMNFAAECCYGTTPPSVKLWKELAIHGIPTALQYNREKKANHKQIFPVSGLSLIDDPLFTAC